MRIPISLLAIATTATKQVHLANKKVIDFFLFLGIVTVISYLKLYGGYTYNFRDDFIALDAVNLIEQGWLPSSDFTSPIGPFFYFLLWSLSKFTGSITATLCAVEALCCLVVFGSLRTVVSETAKNINHLRLMVVLIGLLPFFPRYLAIGELGFAFLYNDLLFAIFVVSVILANKFAAAKKIGGAQLGIATVFGGLVALASFTKISMLPVLITLIPLALTSGSSKQKLYGLAIGTLGAFIGFIVVLLPFLFIIDVENYVSAIRLASDQANLELRFQNVASTYWKAANLLIIIAFVVSLFKVKSRRSIFEAAIFVVCTLLIDMSTGDTGLAYPLLLYFFLRLNNDTLERVSVLAIRIAAILLLVLPIGTSISYLFHNKTCFSPVGINQLSQLCIADNAFPYFIHRTPDPSNFTFLEYVSGYNFLNSMPDSFTTLSGLADIVWRDKKPSSNAIQLFLHPRSNIGVDFLAPNLFTLGFKNAILPRNFGLSEVHVSKLFLASNAGWKRLKASGLEDRYNSNFKLSSDTYMRSIRIGWPFYFGEEAGLQNSWTSRSLNSPRRKRLVEMDNSWNNNLPSEQKAVTVLTNPAQRIYQEENGLWVAPATKLNFVGQVEQPVKLNRACEKEEVGKQEIECLDPKRLDQNQWKSLYITFKNVQVYCSSSHSQLTVSIKSDQRDYNWDLEMSCRKNYSALTLPLKGFNGGGISVSMTSYEGGIPSLLDGSTDDRRLGFRVDGFKIHYLDL